MSTPGNASPIRVTGSCPLDCPDACSWIVTVEDGVATRLRGNPDHPFTQGGLCKKVNPWLEYAADPSRLMTPLRRVGAKGEGKFEPISWDDALAEISERFAATIEAHGAEAVYAFPGTGNVGWIQGAGTSGARFFNAIGASTNRITVCSVSGHVGLAYSSGLSASLDPEEFAEAGTVLLWGTNTLVANQHFWPFVEQASERGANIIVVDPVATRTALRADHHIAPRPGTDGALALGLCRQLIEIGALDASFAAARTLGFDEFAESIAPWTLAATAAECGVSEAAIEQVAQMIADGGPLAVKLGQGMQRHRYGGQAARVISCLPAIVGSYGKRGGGLVYSTSGPYGLNWAKGTGADITTSTARSLASTRLAETLNELDDPPVKAIMIYGANPMVSNAQTDEIAKGLAREDLFTVAVELYQTDTSVYADIVLPSTMQHEQFEMNDSFAHLYLNWNEPAVEPPGECLPHTEIFRRLAAAMGVTDPGVYATDLEIAADVIDTPTYRDAGVTVEQLRAEGFVRLPLTDPYTPLTERFPTASGRFEYISERAEADGHGRLPNYRPASEQVEASGQYALIANGSDHHLNSVFAGTAKVKGATARPPLVINTDDAARDGLVGGTNVVVINDRGQFEAELVVSDQARPGVASTTKGWWGQGVNATSAEGDSDMAQGAVFHDNVVRIQSSE